MNLGIFHRYCYLVVSLLLMTTSAFAQPLAPAYRTFPVIKGERDTANYRYLVLNNSLKVLLISDASAEKSAAALNVHIGSHQDPKSRPGLAHFLEHMLFLGTEKYPSASDYQDFISQHGGDNNAYTAEENTEYYFDIEHSFLEPALDRFAQFFIAPSFQASYVEREKNAVNAEYLARIRDDELREWDVLRNTFNPNHPASTFSVGNFETLSDQEGHPLRDDLIAFYQNHYSANLMTLVVVGNQSLDDLQKMVEARFAVIPNHNKAIADTYPSLFLPDVLPATVQIKPVKETRKLSIVFPIPNYASRYTSKPWEYIAHLLGSESAGSLLTLFKGLGWATSLEVNELLKTRQEGLFSISIDLTREGVKAKDQILSAVFDYIKTVSTRGVAEWRFNEEKQISELAFRFNEKKSALDTVVDLAEAMQHYAPGDVLWGDFAYTQFDESLLKQALSYLRKDNALVVFTSPETVTNSLSSYYQTPYAINSGIDEILELKPMYHQKLFLPERNIFIPKNTAVKAPPMLSTQEDDLEKNRPKVIMKNDQLTLWFLQDASYHSPKAELNFRFKLPALNGSLENVARLQLYVALLNDQLNEYTYSASLAGLYFAMTANARGFDMHVAGYTDKQSLFISKILEAMDKSEFSTVRFEKVKEDLLREFRNADKNLPSTVLAKKIFRLQTLPHWSESEFIDVVQQTTFEQFTSFSAQMLRGAKMDALFYGNLYAQDASKLVALIEHELLQKTSNKLPQLAKVLRLDNKNNRSWLYTYPLAHNDHVAELYLQALSPSFNDTAHFLLLTQILSSPFFNQLRTEKQLGYIVSASPLSINNIEGGLFVIQSSSVKSESLMTEINHFLDNAQGVIADNFDANKNALIAQLTETPVSLSDQSEKYWQSILLEDVNFSRDQELAKAVTKVTQESLIKYFEMVFLQKNRRLWLTNDHIDNVQDYELIRNITDYQQKQIGYLYQ